MFKIEKVFDYKVQDTDGRQVELMDIHVRGSSEKEAINVYNKKIMFFLHGDTLYEWTKMPESYVEKFNIPNELKMVCKVENKRLHHIDDSQFIFLKVVDGEHEICSIKISNIEYYQQTIYRDEN
jgi:hypothetical protein